MKTKSFILLLMCFFLSNNLFAQIGCEKEMNKFNSKGLREGLWEKAFEHGGRSEYYYHNGMRSGICKEFSQNGNLRLLGEYRNDTITGTWYFFGDCGHLMLIQKDFKKNDKPVPAYHRTIDVRCPFQCYSTDYHLNGVKESEGILLWVDHPISEMTFEYGEWKYYDETGKLINTKVFK